MAASTNTLLEYLRKVASSWTGGFLASMQLMAQLVIELERYVADYLLRAYGGMADQVAGVLAEVGPARLAAAHPFLEAEVVWAARHELAQTALDVLAHRTRLAFLDQAAAKAALPRVVEILAAELDWDGERQRRERAKRSHGLKRESDWRRGHRSRPPQEVMKGGLL